MKTAIIIFAVICSLSAKAQEKNFDVTTNYIKEIVENYSVPFKHGDSLKVTKIDISKNGKIELIYNNTKVTNSFNIHNLRVIDIANDKGKCKCGISLHEGSITFWVSDEKGISIKVGEQYS